MLKFLPILILFISISFNGFSQDPIGTLEVPVEEFIGEDFCFSYDVVNDGPDAGFNPYVRLFIPPGITFSNATYGDYNAVADVVGVLPNTPILDPIISSGTSADTINGPAGHTLIILQVSVGSLVMNGPVLKFQICGTVDANATIGVPVDILAQPVYELGDTPLGTNGPIVGNIDSKPITPILFKASKSGPSVINPGGGSSDCHIYPYILNIDIAAAGSIDGPIIFSDDMGPDIVYGGNLILPEGCSAVEPSVGSTGGNLTITCNGSYDGSTDADDIVVQYDAYVHDILNEAICDTKKVQNNASFNVDGYPIELDSVETIVEHVTLSHSNDNDLIVVQQTVTYTINASITEYTAGISSAVIEFIVPDGMEYNETSLTFDGSNVSNAFYTITPGPGNGSTVSVDIHSFVGADFLPCALPDLVYTANVREFYDNGSKVLSRDNLNHTSSITYDLVEGATGCESESGVGSIIQGVIISKTVNNSPPNPSLGWLPGDIVQYRLELQIPSLDANDAVITDFFPIPIHNVTDLASSFGTDVRFEGSSCWNNSPIAYIVESATNSLRLEFGDISDNETGDCVDIVLLIDIPITTVPFANNLFHSNFNVVSTDNSEVDDDIIDALTLINVKAPSLSDFNKSVASSSNSSASITSNGISNVDAGDTINFKLSTKNIGGAYAYDVQVRDVVPNGLASCFLDPSNPLTYSDNTIAGYTGGFSGNQLVIDLSDSLDPQGLAKDGFTIRYSCIVEDDVQPLEVLTNYAEMDWSSDQGAPKFPAIKDESDVTISDLSVKKSIDTIYPSNALPNRVVIGDFIKYQVVITIPEGEMTNVRFRDLLDEGLAFVRIDSIYSNSSDLSPTSATLYSFIGNETYSSNGSLPNGEDRVFDLNIGNVKNINSDNNVEEQIIIEYTTTVINSSNNKLGTNLNNRFDVIWNNPNGGGNVFERATAPNVTITEPLLESNKSFLNSSLVPGGQTFVTLNLAHLAGSNATAYDVTFSDTLKLGLNYIPSSAVFSGSHSATPVLNIVGNTISVSIDSLTKAENISLIFKVEVDESFPYCQVIENCMDANWSSIYNSNLAGLPTGINNTLVGERTGVESNVGGVNNTYSSKSCVNIYTTNELAFDPNITSTGAVCEGGSVSLSVQQYTGQVVTYNWFGPGVPAGFNSNVLSFDPVTLSEVGTYYVVVEVDGCVSDTSQVFDLQIFENPTVAPSNNGTLCFDESNELTLSSNVSAGTSPYSYTWTGPNNYMSSAQNPIIYNPTNNTAGSYLLSVTDNNGCSAGPMNTDLLFSKVPVKPALSSNSPVCEGEQITIQTNTIYTGSSINYNWSGPNGAIVNNSSSIILNSPVSGLYKLEVEVDGCTSDESEINIIVSPKPNSPLPTSSSPSCSSDYLSLFANSPVGSNYGYQWTGPNGFVSALENPTIQSVNQSNAGNYILTITNSAGCTSQGSVQVVINSVPQTPIFNSSQTSVCVGEDFTLTSNVSYSGTLVEYNWNTPNGIVTTTTPTLTVNSAQIVDGGSYSLSVDVDGCTSNASGTTVVTVNEISKTPNITSTSTVLCNGETFSLSTTTVANSYNWTGPNGFSSTNMIPASIVANATTAGTYTLNVTKNGCVSADTSILISVNPLPATPTLTGTTILCYGESIVLSTNSTCSTFKWIGPGGTSANPLFTTNTNSLTISSSDLAYASGEWKVICVSADGCESPLSNILNVKINSVPNAVADNNGPICNNSALQLTGNTVSGATYQWYNETYTTLLSTNSSHIINGLTTGTYTYNYIVSSNGCSDTVTTVAIVDAVQQAPSISPVNPNICVGDMIVLGTSTSANTYSWSGPNGFTSNSQYPAAIPANSTTAGLYTLSVTVNGCGSADASVNVIVNPLPRTPTLNAANKNVCQGDDIVLTTNATATGYLWIAPNGDTITTQIPSLTVSSGVNYTSGNWSLVTVNTNGCISNVSNSLMVNLYDNPIAIASNNSPICNGESVVLTGNTSSSATYEWLDTSNTTLLSTDAVYTINNLTAGTYTYNYVLTVNGCTDTTSTVVIVSDIPAAPSISSSELELCEGETFTLSTSTLADSYSWTGPNGFTSSSQYPQVLNASTATAGTYNLSVIVDGCTSASSSLNIFVNPLPDTPILNVSNNNVCQGDNIVLNTNALATDYLWIAPNGDTVTTQVPTLTVGNGVNYVAGNWSLITANTNGCLSDNSNNVLINILANPNAIASNNSPICNNGSVILTGNTAPNGTYEWFDENYTTLLSTDAVHSVNSLNAGTYTYNYILNVNGCVDTATTVVTISITPQAPSIASTDVELCEGGTFALSTSTVASSYSWTGPNGFISNSQYPSVLTASSATAGIYTLSVVGSDGCESTDATIEIIVNPLPVQPTITGPTTLCFGEPIVLTTSSTCASFKWIGPGGASVTTLANPLLTTGVNTTTIPSTDAAYAAGEWRVVCVSADGCDSPISNPITITINPVPTAIASNNGPICNNTSLQLIGNTISGATHEWYDENFSNLLSSSQNHIISGLTSGTYTYNYIVNANGCIDTVTTVATVDAVQQAPSISAIDTEVCVGEIIVLGTSTSANSYAWNGPNGFTSSNQYPAAIPASALTAGEYTLNVTTNGCGAADASVNITVNPLPTKPVLNVLINDVCQGEGIMLTTNAVATDYLWIASSGDTITTQTPNLTVSGGANYASGSWTLVVGNANGCLSNNSNIQAINLYANPNAIATNNGLDCTSGCAGGLNCYTGPICNNGNVILLGNTATNGTYEWFNEDYSTLLSTSNTYTFSGLSAGTYTFNYILNVNGCVDTTSTVVTIEEIPQAPSISSTELDLCAGGMFSLGSATLADSYMWTGPNGFSSSSQYPQAVTASGLTAGTYNLTVIEDGCESESAAIDITVTPLPAQPTITGPTTLCFGEPIVLTTSSTCASFKWIGPGGASVTTLANPLLTTGMNTTTIPSTDVAYAAGEWRVICVSADGCESPMSEPITITINPIPVVIASNSGPVCNNTSLDLIGNTITGATYQWFDESFTTLLSTNTNHTINGLTSGTYIYNYIVSVNGCSDTVSTVATVNTVQQAPSISAIDTEVCVGEMIVLGTSTVADTYSWAGPNGFSSTNQYPAGIPASVLTAGEYTLSITTNGCGTAINSVNITVNPLPNTPVLSAFSNNVCQGEDIVLTTGANAIDYLWIASNGDTTITQTPSLTVNSGVNYSSGNWTLVVGNANGCLSNNSNNQMINLYANPNALASNDGPICNGGTVTLTGNTSTNGTYEWYDENYTTLLSTNAVHSINNMSTGTYTFNYILNVNGCVDTATTVVKINSTLSAPDITSTDVELCEGGVFSLGTSTVAENYTWTGPNGFTSSSQYPQAITASSVTAGTYNLSVASNGCVSAGTSIRIVVNALPAQPTITGTTSICLGDTLKLMTSFTCGNYLWIGPGGSSVTTLSNPLLTTTTNYTYIPSTDSAYAAGDWSVICISSDGCESPMSNSINVNIIQVPDEVYVTSNSPVCEGESISLTTNSVAGASYLWTGPNGYSSAVQNPVINNAKATHNGDYSVVVKFNGCSSNVSIPTTVVVNPIPATPEPTSNSALCESDTLFLFAKNTGDTYQWTGPNGFSSTVANPVIVNATPVNKGFYNLTITENGCSSPVGQVQVDIINSNYIPTISSNVTDLCEGEELILNTTGFSGGNSSYVWYGPSGVLDTTANPTYINTNIQVLESGNYYVEVLTGICSSLPSQLVMIHVNPTPLLPNITADTVVCEGNVIHLSTNTVAHQYSWTGPNGFTSSLQNPQVISSATLSDAGLYSLSVAVNGCLSNDSTVNITVNPKPQTPAMFSNSPICVGNEIILSTPNMATSYEWILPDASVVVTTNDTLIISPATMADQGIYSLRVETNGCYSDAVTLEVSIDDPTTAIAYAGDDMVVCDGASSVNLSSVNNGTGFWETTSSAVIITPFDHNTTVTNLQTDSSYIFVWTLTQGACGGLSTDTLLVNVPSYPVAVGDSAEINENGSVLVDVLANDSYLFTVNLNTITAPNYGVVSNNNNQLNYVNTGTAIGDQFIYEICLEDCPTMCDTAYVNISIKPLINVPDIITPNGDGKNDAFVIEGIENYPNNEFYIFNRWGNEVYSTDDYQNDWDGTINGKELPDGTYFYVFNSKDTGELIINGYITLHR